MSFKELVLDTNVVLDWLVFTDHSLNLLMSALAMGSVTLVSHEAAEAELQRVVTYPLLNLNAVRQANVLSTYQAQTRRARLPDGFTLQNLMLPAGFPRCRDPDDQLFLALAFHAGAALVSRDRAVLSLTQRVRRFGVQIVTVPQLATWLAKEGISISHHDG